MADKKQTAPTRSEPLRTWAEILQDPSADLLHKMSYVYFDVSLLRKGVEDAILDRMKHSTSEDAQSWREWLDFYEHAHFTSLVHEVAAATGTDPAQIANKDTRTPAQQQALLEADDRRQRNRKDRFFGSNYMEVMQALNEVNSQFDEPADPDQLSVRETFILYYFATRTDIRPSEAGQLTEADKEALVERYRRYEAFLVKYFGSVEHAASVWDDEFVPALEAFISAENPADAQEVMENLTSLLPSKYVMPNNKLANVMTKGIIDNAEFILEESRKGSKKVIETSCILTYEGDDVHLSGRQKFTDYDRSVYNGVASLYVYGDPSHIFTPAMVYRAMNGQTGTEKPSKGHLAAVTRSLDKMRFIRVKIDCTKELQARGLTINSQQINNGEIDTYLLAADVVKVQAGGQTVRAYKLIKPPILYEYAATVNQVLTLPSATLDIRELNPDGSTGARISNTGARISIRDYLIRRIEGLKGKNSLNNPVIALCDYERNCELHQGLYSIAGKPDATRSEMKRIREDAEKMFEYWVAIGYIRAFAPKAKRKKIVSYGITV